MASCDGSDRNFCLSKRRHTSCNIYSSSIDLYCGIGVLAKKHGDGCSAGNGVLSLRCNWHSARRLVCEKPACIQCCEANSRFDADFAVFRLPDPDHRLLWNGQAAGHSGIYDFRTAADHSFNNARTETGALRMWWRLLALLVRRMRRFFETSRSPWQRPA